MAADAQDLSGDRSAILRTFPREDVVKIEGVVETGEAEGSEELLSEVYMWLFRHDLLALIIKYAKSIKGSLAEIN